MIDPINQAKYLFELEQLKTAIKTELGMDCEIMNQSEEIPIDSLLVKIETDTKGRSRIVSLMFIPLEDSNVDSLKLLQFYCETPIIVKKASARAIVAKILSPINLKIPLGSFCLNSQNEVTYKYVYSLGKFKTIETEEFLETFLLWIFTLDSMSVLIEEVAEGERRLESAIQLLEE